MGDTRLRPWRQSTGKQGICTGQHGAIAGKGREAGVAANRVFGIALLSEHLDLLQRHSPRHSIDCILDAAKFHLDLLGMVFPTYYLV